MKKPKTEWWVVDKPLDKGGEKISGPYKSLDSAAMARLWVEQADLKAYCLDSEDVDQ